MPSQNSVIVVEDDASMSLALERLFKAAGWHVVIFSSGEALLESGNASEANALVFDIQLPGISGFDLYGQLAKSGVSSPVVFVTAHDRQTSRDLAQRLGAAGYFTKPFRGQQILEALASHRAAA